MNWLTAIPVYNEDRHLKEVLREVRRYSPNVLIVNDGSTDGTARILHDFLANRPKSDTERWNLQVLTHPVNRGYGAALISAFRYAVAHSYDVLVTMDCDGQHQPHRIGVLLEAMDASTHIVSGSRYLRDFRQDTTPPRDRQQINRVITSELNEQLGLNLTDAFCGFKAYRTEALKQLRITETGWGMPLQLWVQAARLGFRIKEVGVPRVYLDPTRAFGGVLDDPEERLAYYRRVIREAEGSYPAAASQFCCSTQPSRESCR
jgi:glycosyltransferase involved in cell wall biosynthesis